ncbi:hypothetical protein SRIMM317S_00352 [Streptomyces rimosus subsp. rimosus]
MTHWQNGSGTLRFAQGGGGETTGAEALGMGGADGADRTAGAVDGAPGASGGTRGRPAAWSRPAVWPRPAALPRPAPRPHPPAAPLLLGRAAIPLEIAASYRARSRGLLGRDGIDGALLLTPRARSTPSVCASRSTSPTSPGTSPCDRPHHAAGTARAPPSPCPARPGGGGRRDGPLGPAPRRTRHGRRPLICPYFGPPPARQLGTAGTPHQLVARLPAAGRPLPGQEQADRPARCASS